MQNCVMEWRQFHRIYEGIIILKMIPHGRQVLSQFQNSNIEFPKVLQLWEEYGKYVQNSVLA